MDLHNRDKLNDQMRRAVAKVLKAANNGKRRQPGWKTLEREIERVTAPIMRKIQIQAIRAMYGRYGDGPAPLDLEPQSAQRAKQLAKDLVDVSKKRWKELGPKRTGKQIADWWETNFGKERAKTIGITETTIAHQSGEDIAWSAMKAEGIKLSGIWRNEKNPCKYCIAMNGKPEKVWRKVYPAGPPSPHPRCQCYIEHERKNPKKSNAKKPSKKPSKK